MRDTSVGVASAKYQVQQRRPGYRNYEIKDHLGNVRTVIADYKNPFSTSGPVSNWTYLADIKNISNTYPYGKSYGTNAIYNAEDDYRYGFNGMEKEKNISSSGNTFDFGARVYDSEFPTFLSRDPLEAEFAYQSSYVFAGNTPIQAIDFNGEHILIMNNQRMTIAALDLAYATEIGREVLSEYTGNDKHLIIFTGDIKLAADGSYGDNVYQASAWTYSAQFKDNFIVDGKINLDYLKAEFPNSYKEFKALEGIKLKDLGISDNDMVSLIKLGNYGAQAYNMGGDYDLFFDNGSLESNILIEIARIAGAHEPRHAIYGEEAYPMKPNEQKKQPDHHERMAPDLEKFDEQVDELEPKIIEDIIIKFENSPKSEKSIDPSKHEKYIPKK